MKKLIFIFLFVSYGAYADDKQDLQNKLSLKQGLFAQFKQTVFDKNKKPIIQGEGELALQVPNKFYWHAKSPDESWIISKGSSVAIINPDLEQVTLMSSQEAIATSPMTLLVQNNKKAWDNYTIKANKECFDLYPKDKTSTLEKFQMCFDKKTLTSVTLYDVQGIESRFVLSQHRFLTLKDKNLFSFSRSKGKKNKYSFTFHTISGKQTHQDVDIDDQRKSLPSKS